ncbi:MAG TPA: hypothetical protein VD886_08910 [Herpetosiphonaceae bacterium]|nr:hypothetical protein [Herpetosiphonaceae bacterium]
MYSAPKAIETRPPWRLRLLLAAHWLVAALPWLFIASMAAWAWRASQSIGHWPVPLDDDPKFIAMGDGIYDWLGGLVNTMITVVFFSLFTLPATAALTWRDLRPELRYGLLAFYALGLLMIPLDPFGLFAWIVD